jgi:dCMP deaminase
MCSTSDRVLIDAAKARAAHSTDRSRQVGCVIADKAGQIVSEGWNTVPNGCTHTEERHARPAKYAWTEHAERNAIYAAARRGQALDGTTIYVPWFPCADCARAIVQSGITSMVSYPPDFSDPSWGDDFRMVAEMLNEAGVEMRFQDGVVKAAS